MSRLSTIPPDRGRDNPERRDVSMLDWWRGTYDHVFVALHPYYAAPVDSDDPALEIYAHAKTAATTGWRDIAGRLGETDFARFALATLLGGYGMTGENRRPGMKPVPDDRLIATLRARCDADGLAFPWDDSPSPAIETALGESYSRLGASTVTGWSEFRDESAVIAVTDLRDPRTPCAAAVSHGVYAYLDPDRGMLATASFDEIWTLVALTDSARDKTSPEELFEGFWAGPETTVNWVNEPGSYTPPEGWT